MRALKFAAVVSLLAFGVALTLQGSGTSAAGEKKGDKKTIVLHLMKLKVAETNAKGESWDINGGKPDPYVTIKNLSDKSGKEFKTKVTDDVFEVDYMGLATVRAVEGDNLQIEVWDKDLVGSDLIGRTKLPITRELIDKGKTALKFDQVLSLTVEFRAP